MLVARDDLAVANARLQTGFITLNQLAGPPLGAALFAAGAAWPFVARGVLVGLGVLLVPRVAAAARAGAGAAPRDAARTIAEGFRWALRHAAVRTLALTILIFNITFGAAWSVLVLYAARAAGARRGRLRAGHHVSARRRPARHASPTAGSRAG